MTAWPVAAEILPDAFAQIGKPIGLDAGDLAEDLEFGSERPDKRSSPHLEFGDSSIDTNSLPTNNKALLFQ